MEGKIKRASPKVKHENSASNNFMVREVFDPLNLGRRRLSPELIPKKTHKFFSPDHSNTWNNETRTCEKILRFFHKPNEENTKRYQQKIGKVLTEQQEDELKKKKQLINDRVSQDRKKIQFNQKLRRTLQKECDQMINCWVEDEGEVFTQEELRIHLNSRSKDNQRLNLHGFAKNIWNDMCQVNPKNTKILLAGCVIKREEDMIANVRKKLNEEENTQNLKKDYFLQKKEELREKLHKRHTENILLEKKTGKNILLIDNKTFEHIPPETIESDLTSSSSYRLGCFPIRFKQTADVMEIQRLHSSPSINDRLSEKKQSNKKVTLALNQLDLDGLMIAEIDNINSTANLDKPLVKAIMSSPVCQENVENMKNKSRPNSHVRPRTARRVLDNDMKYMPEQLLRNKFVLTKTFTDFEMVDDDNMKREELNDEINKFQKAAEGYKKGFSRNDLSSTERKMEINYRK